MTRRGTGSVPGNVPDPVGLARSLRHDARYAVSLRGLPLRVATFLWRAHRHAVRSGDRFSRNSAIRPAEAVELLALARGRSAVAELGTGTGWSALVLALDDGGRSVVSLDPVVRSEREDYLAMVDSSVRERIDLRDEPDVREAVRQLELSGEERGGLFVWRAP